MYLPLKLIVCQIGLQVPFYIPLAIRQEGTYLEAAYCGSLRVQSQQALVGHAVRPTTNSAVPRPCEAPASHAILSISYSPD